MTLPAWPACFPDPIVQGYSVNLSDANNARGAVGVGPATSRNRNTRQSASVNVVYTMSEVQLGIFEAWHHWTINDGAAWFTSDQAGEGLESNTCRFSGGYTATLLNSGFWSVSSTLIIDQPYRSA